MCMKGDNRGLTFQRGDDKGIFKADLRVNNVFFLGSGSARSIHVTLVTSLVLITICFI